MDTVSLYGIGLLLFCAGLWIYRVVVYGPSVEETMGVWLPALLASLSGMGLVSGLAWLLLGPVRSHALLSLLCDRWRRSLTPGDYWFDFAEVFTGSALFLFFVLKRVLGQSARQRSDAAVAKAIQEDRAARHPHSD